MDKSAPSLDGAGRFYSAEEKQWENLKRFFPWRSKDSGMGPVRGYTVTYSPKYGAQAWVFMELRLREGYRNMPCLVGQGKIRISSKADFEHHWTRALNWMQDTFPYGLHGFVEFDETINRHRIQDYDRYEFYVEPPPIIQPAPPKAPEPTVDIESGGVVSESPTG